MRQLSCIGVIVLVIGLASANAATHRLLLSKTDYEAAAGDTVTIEVPAEVVPLLSRIDHVPANRIPIGVDNDNGTLFLAVPLSAEPGSYSVPLSLSTSDITYEGIITLAVLPLPPLEQSSRLPVVLLNGFQLDPFCPAARSSSDTFGVLESLLNRDGAATLFFDNCRECPNCTIEDLGARLDQVLSSLRYTSGSPIEKVDIVAHSMGGLIVRSYLTGKRIQRASFVPPSAHKVNKAVFIGTPHFGVGIALGIGNQSSRLRLGSNFLWDLNQWNQGTDDFREVDAIAVIGAGGYSGQAASASDGVVALTSAALSFAPIADERTRIVPYCHIDNALLHCSNTTPLAKADKEQHLTAKIVRSFLSGSNEWRSLGWTPSQDQYLSKYAGVYFAMEDANGNIFTDVTRVSYQVGNSTELLQELSDGIFVSEFVPAGIRTFTIDLRGQRYTINFNILPGAFRVQIAKFGPILTWIQPAAGSPLRTITLAPGSLVSIFGANLATNVQQASSVPLPTALAGTRVTVNGTAIGLLYASPNQINAYLPAGLSGLAHVVLSGSSGQATTTIMLSPAVPTIFSVNGSGTGPAVAVSAVTGRLVDGTNPAKVGDYLTLFATGLGNTFRSAGVDWTSLRPALHIYPLEDIPIQFAGLTPGFIGLYQINFQVPIGVDKNAAVPAVISSDNHFSNVVTLNIR